MSDYWIVCISEALDEAGISATKEQIELVAEHAESGHENYGMCHYQPLAGDYRDSEIKELKRKLSAEQSKIICPECAGKGYERIQGPYRSSESACWKCRGDKRVSP